MSDLDEWITKLRACKLLTETQVRTLCLRAIDILVEESNVQTIHSPVTICGDIHGQFFDVSQQRAATAYPRPTVQAPSFTPSFFLAPSADLLLPPPLTSPLSLPLAGPGALQGGRRLPEHELLVHG